ncbi:unnamed protein product [Anisakis simplex]|uniref:Uncharacterized protein n=1 Tax=Anisakis simplex TaxID=6269 RepID=A0A0M3JL54_ANISI|nr:unnamed protein product [Anisakis simplex]
MKHEFMVDMERMKSISVIQCNDPMPHVTLMAVHFTTVANEKKENEVDDQFI